MSQKLPFTKMHGAGNDYIYINGFKEEISAPEDLAQKMSDRHFGVGSDGLVLVLPSSNADLRMRMFNADGTEAEMCGNATRCVGKFAWDNGLIKKNIIHLETAAGIKIIHLHIEDGHALGGTVDMGEPVLAPRRIPLSITPPEGADTGKCVGWPIIVNGETVPISAVSMGNPHAVVFRSDVATLDLAAIGPDFETHEAFPNRTNTEFVEVLSRSRIRMRVWERGSGETLACGTGACAAVVACVLNGLTGREVDVDLPGGQLHVNWDAATNHVFLSGPAVTVFNGEYLLDY